MKLPIELQYIQNSFKPQRTTSARIDGKICVITGATSGVGFEAAKRSAQGGAHIVMVCRNEEKALRVQALLKAEYGVPVDFFIADFSKLSEVHQVALEIAKTFPAIDVLINNAGVFNKRRQLTQDGFEMTFGIIHLASFLLTKMLLENLNMSASARVLFISSEAHRFGGLNINDHNWKKRPYIGLLAYGAAKIAQIHTAQVFAEQFIESGITFNIVHPGAVRTNIGMNNNFLYRFYSRYILYWFLKDPALAGEAIYFLAADPSMEGVTGKFFNQTIEEAPAWYAVRSELRPLVWERSEAMIKPFLEGVQ